MLSIHSLFLICILYLTNVAFGDVQVVSPKEGATFSASGGTASIELQWMDNGAYPPIDKISYYTFTLETGPNLEIQAVGTIKKEVSPDDVTSSSDVYSYTVEIDADMAGPGQFYIQVYAFVDSQGYTINYSPRFTLTSMSGASTYTYTGTAPPVGQTDIQTTTTTAAASIDTRSFTISYTDQTGISRFAPMQLQPATQITATSWTRRFQTSAVTYYSTYRSSLDQQTTITPGWSYTLSSGMNLATPAVYPSANGGWYDPKERLTLSTRKINLKKRSNDYKKK